MSTKKKVLIGLIILNLVLVGISTALMINLIKTNQREIKTIEYYNKKEK